MKILILYGLYITSICCLIFSCSKHGDKPADPPSQPTLGTMHINLESTISTDPTEIVFSEAGGKVLLDTLSPITGNLIADLRTNEKLVDVTIILHDTARKRYVIYTEKSVDPSVWVTLANYTDFYAPIDDIPYKSSTVHYKNFPAPPSDYIWTSTGVGSFGGGIIQNSADVWYQNYGAGRYLYTLLPNSGLYDFHLLTSDKDTVDLSHMDTAVKTNVHLPAEFALEYLDLVAVMDTTDYNRSLWIWDRNKDLTAVDVEYPRKLVQKYETGCYGTGGKNSVFYFTYADTVTTNMPMPASSSISVTSSQKDNFTVSYNGVHPSSSSSFWTTASGNILWYLEASPDSTTIRPLKTLSSLDARMLKGVDLSPLTANYVQYELVDKMDYPGRKVYEHSPSLRKSARIRTGIRYVRLF